MATQHRTNAITILWSDPNRGKSGPGEGLGIQLLGIVCLFVLSVNLGPWGHWVSSCGALSVIFVCQFRASGDTGAPAVRYCLFFLVCQFRASGDTGASAVGCCLFFVVYQFRASGDTGAQAVGHVLFFLVCQFQEWVGTLGLHLSCIVSLMSCLSMAGLGGHWASSCWDYIFFFVCQVAPAVVYCLFFLSVNFRLRGTLGLQLSSVGYSFCLLNSGFWGH
jgi:hypothetical protein